LKNSFTEFIGEEIKAPYKDGNQLKIARGTLKGVEVGFIKVVGRLGTIVINSNNIQKMSLIRKKKYRQVR